MGKIIFILSLAIFLAGCVVLPIPVLPIPHEECYQPEIKGVVLNESGVPIQNVNIEIKIEQIDLVLNATTNQNGEYQIPSKCGRKNLLFFAKNPNVLKMKLYLSYSGYTEKEIVRYINYGRYINTKKKRVINFRNITLNTR